MSDAERIPLVFHATDAIDAIAQAKAWVKAEPNLRLRTIASVLYLRQEGSLWTTRPLPSGQSGGNWCVTVAVNVLSRVVAE